MLIYPKYLPNQLKLFGEYSKIYIVLIYEKSVFLKLISGFKPISEVLSNQLFRRSISQYKIREHFYIIYIYMLKHILKMLLLNIYFFIFSNLLLFHGLS